jgi:uncharacterized phage-associated protein
MLSRYPCKRVSLTQGELLVGEVFFPDGGSGTVFSGERVPDLALFSAEEQATLARIADELGRKTSKRLRDMSHAESAWQDTPERSMIDYAKATDLSI